MHGLHGLHGLHDLAVVHRLNQHVVRLATAVVPVRDVLQNRPLGPLRLGPAAPLEVLLGVRVTVRRRPEAEGGRGGVLLVLLVCRRGLRGGSRRGLG